MQRSNRPTHSAIADFFAYILPHQNDDVPRQYHIPRHPRYAPETAIADQIVLSVAPTPGVYSLIGYSHDSHPMSDSQTCPRPPRTLCFLHRPFGLDRRNVRRGTLVLACHKRFDEVLTVGWNTAVAKRLGMCVEDSTCVQGYKGDPERRIGIVGPIAAARKVLLRRIEEEFGELEMVTEGGRDIHVVAIMNAFHEDEVQRVVDMARDRGWISDDTTGAHILYLTGQPRMGGLHAAKALGMTVACVGHRQAEDWGIRYLAARLRHAFPSVHVKEVYEKEDTLVRQVPSEKSRAQEVAAMTSLQVT